MYIDKFLSKSVTSKINKLIEFDVDLKIEKYPNGDVSNFSGKMEFFGFVRYFSLYKIDVDCTNDILIAINNIRAKFISVLKDPISDHSDMLRSDLISRWVYLNLKNDTCKTMRPVDKIIDDVIKNAGSVEDSFNIINNPYFNLYEEKTVSQA